MKNIIKDLWLAIVLITGASAILLLSDLEQRKVGKSDESKKLPQLAIMQISSTPLLDRHVEGILDGLQAAGFLAENRQNIKLYNALGDLTTANTIAKELTNGSSDIVITSSTIALQTFAKANQHTQKTHVFGAVTDPFGAGVGIFGKEPSMHPPYLAGVGTFQPVQKAFRILKELNPSIKKVGVVWNPGEQCSEACILEARLACKELGITLIEAVATNTSEVSEAARSLFSKGVEAIWIGGDTVANASSLMIINLAKQNGIPVFTNDPTDAKSGALFGLGADYYTVGKYTADIVIAILNGKKPSEFRIENIIPEQLEINKSLLSQLGSKWKITDSISALLPKVTATAEKERVILDFESIASKGITVTPEMLLKADSYQHISVKNGRPAKVAVITLVENRLLEEAVKGVEAGMQWSGLVEGVDYQMKSYSAQGEIAQLPQIIEAVMREKPDVIVSVTTPAMMAIASKVKEIPVVLTVTSNPTRLRVFANGRPDNICGVHDNPPLNDLVEMALKYDPGLKTFGIVYDASQMNSVLSVETLREVIKSKKLKLVEATASNVTELGLATQAILQRGAKAIIVSADNLVNTGFAAIHRVAEPAGIPIFATEPQLVEQGATGALGDSFTDWGMQSGKLVAKVLAGVPPKLLPLSETETHTRIDPKKLKSNTQQAKPLKLSIVQYSETEFSERCHEGLIDGIARSGMKEGVDYVVRTLNAQGDMSTLSSIMTTVKADQVDLLMVISTPSLQAALRQAGADTKIVFTGVGDAVKAGAGKSETDHLPNVTGITTRSPFDGMARIINETMPDCKSVGTLFTPAEINSVLYKDWFKDALASYGITLVAVPVTSSADVSQAAIELCRKDIQLVCQIVDNMTRPGFALIARKAADNGMPVYVFDSDQMRDGGTICLARDYYDAGLEAAEKAVQILRGTSPNDIPFSNTQSEKFMYNPEKIQTYGIKLSESLRSKAVVFTQK
jgi:ABC-type uncharacterized transport system substrate-binding protein